MERVTARAACIPDVRARCYRLSGPSAPPGTRSGREQTLDQASATINALRKPGKTRDVVARKKRKFGVFSTFEKSSAGQGIPVLHARTMMMKSKMQDRKKLKQTYF